MRKRIIIFVGITVVESIVHYLFGIPILTNLVPVMAANAVSAQFVHLVYEKKIFNGGN